MSKLLLSGTGSPCVPGIIASCPPGMPQSLAGGGLPGNPFIPSQGGQLGKRPIYRTEPDFGQTPLAFRGPAANLPESAGLALLGLDLAAIGYQRRKRSCA